MCGLRPGELQGLRWRDVDFDGRVIRVRHALSADLVLGELKTEKSRRTLVLPGGRRGGAPRAARAAGCGPAAPRRGVSGPGPRVLPGGRLAAAAAGCVQAVPPPLQGAGIGEDWHPHELRHTHVSLLSAAGVDMEDIADSVGHVNSVVTRTVYRHQISDTVARAAAAMDRIFGAGSAS